MRESGFRRWTLLGQRELVRAAAHIPRQVSSAPQINRYTFDIEQVATDIRDTAPAIARLVHPGSPMSATVQNACPNSTQPVAHRIRSRRDCEKECDPATSVQTADGLAGL